jgi:hypothetical protein
MSKTKVDLALLKGLVLELEKQLDLAEHVLTEDHVDKFVLEASKADGIAGAIMSESTNVSYLISKMISGARAPKNNRS